MTQRPAFACTEDILGYPVTALTLEQCISLIVEMLESGERHRYLVCANPHSLEQARKDSFFEKSLQEADLIVPDGIGIVLASRILGGNIRKRITGSDIFSGVNRILDYKGGKSCFFLGSTEDNLKSIADNMARDYPNVRIAGTFSPPFRDRFSAEEKLLMIEKINSVQPDLLWVGMTAPKQEKWIFENRERLNVKFIGAIGAVFDFYTGRVKRSHPFFQNSGLEWLPRLLREPRRLWRRNVISSPLFLSRIISTRVASFCRDIRI